MPISKPLVPYGILAFSSENCERYKLMVSIGIIDMKKNQITWNSKSYFFLRPSKTQKSSFEVTFGFQIPYKPELRRRSSVSAFNKLTKSMVEDDILDEKTISRGSHLHFYTLNSISHRGSFKTK